ARGWPPRHGAGEPVDGPDRRADVVRQESALRQGRVRPGRRYRSHGRPGHRVVGPGGRACDPGHPGPAPSRLVARRLAAPGAPAEAPSPPGTGCNTRRSNFAPRYNWGVSRAPLLTGRLARYILASPWRMSSLPARDEPPGRKERVMERVTGL